MFDQLLSAIRDAAKNDIIDNPAIPNELNETAINHIAQSVFQVIQGRLLNGGSPADLMNGDLIGTITARVATALEGQVGLAPEVAQNTAATVMPKVMQGMLHSLMNNEGLGSILSSLFSSPTDGAPLSQGSSPLAGLLKMVESMQGSQSETDESSTTKQKVGSQEPNSDLASLLKGFL